MAKIKPLNVIADKWATVTPLRAADYKAGVQDSTVDWAGPTAAASESYSAGVQAAAADGRFARGVTKAGTAKWRRKAVDVGATRWGPGVTAAKPDYQAGFQPFHAVIQGVTLPPRMARGDPRNLDRVRAITEALHDAKVRGV